jgi:hypothetical protein
MFETYGKMNDKVFAKRYCHPPPEHVDESGLFQDSVAAAIGYAI